MTLFATVLGITIFVLVIGFSIAFHEWGHFTTARRYGLKVSEFMVGFGPLLWGRTRGETTYGLKAIPMGGYVRILGMFPPAKGQPAPHAEPYVRWHQKAEVYAGAAGTRASQVGVAKNIPS